MSLIDRLPAVLNPVRHSETLSRYTEALTHDLAPHLTKRLRRRLRVLMLIGSVMLLIAAYDVVIHPAALLLAVPAAAVGLAIGLLMGRISLFSWDAEARKVTAKMDAFGAVLLFVYILLVTNRRELLGHWLTADMLAATSIAMAGATLMGRNLSMRKGIHGILKEVGLAPTAGTRDLATLGEL